MNPRPEIKAKPDYVNAPRFTLRCDFPEEHCWIDRARVLHPIEKFRESQLADYMTYEKYAAQIEQVEPGPLFGYFAFRWQAYESPSALMFDGVRYYVIDYEGLFTDLCHRVNRAMKLDPSAPCPIVPPPVTNDLKINYREPSHFVYHFRDKGTACVLPYHFRDSVKWAPWLPV